MYNGKNILVYPLNWTLYLTVYSDAVWLSIVAVHANNGAHWNSVALAKHAVTNLFRSWSHCSKNYY